MALEIRGVGQDQIGERDGLRLECITDDDERDLVFAVRIAVVQHLANLRRVHRRVPGHIGHEHEQRVDPIRIAAPGIGDDVVHQPVRGQRMFPREALVDANRLAVFVDRKLIGARGKTERRRVQRGVRFDVVPRFRRLHIRRNRARKRRLVTEPAGPIDRPQQRHQDRERANRMEAVRMRGKSAHGMERDRVAGRRWMMIAPRIGPRNRQLDGLPGDRPELDRELSDSHCRNAGDRRRPFGGAISHAIGKQSECWTHALAVQHVRAVQCRLATRHAADMAIDRAPDRGVPPELVVRIVRIDRIAFRIHHEQSVIGTALVLIHELRTVGVARDEIVIVHFARDELVDQREHQRAVGAGANRNPFVGDRRIAGADRIDRDEAAAVALELRERDLHRIAVMIFSGADHHEELRVIEIRAAEFPERAADGVDHSRGHVHRAEAAVRRVVRRAELPREEPGKRLHLVATGE